jgi:hypothetical protein
MSATAGAAPTGGSAATGGSASTGGSTSTSPQDLYCKGVTPTDLGTLPKASAGAKNSGTLNVGTAPVCYRFTAADSADLLQGVQASNCSTGPVQVNGIDQCGSNATNCTRDNLHIARFGESGWYIYVSPGTSTNCTASWWWWH